MATLVQVKYLTKTTGKPAEKDDQGNLILPFHIDRISRIATFDCADVEVVGSHSDRYVTFVADDDCTLHFTNELVFGVVDKSLTKGRNKLRVTATTHCETEYNVTQDLSAMDAEKIMPSSTIGTKVPPKIVVP